MESGAAVAAAAHGRDRKKGIEMDTISTVIDPWVHHAVIFDLDGVVVDTVALRTDIWREVFDDVLSRRAGADRQPFRAADYHTYFDGKPRLDGITHFLASRSISLPLGDPADPPGARTAHAVANRERQLLGEQLERGVPVQKSTMSLVRRLHQAGIATGVYSVHGNGRDILAATGMAHEFIACVDGRTAAELELPGKPSPALLYEAARQLGVLPSRTVVLEDAAAVASGGGFAAVIGIDRSAHPDRSRRDGARLVVPDADAISVLSRTTDPVGVAEATAYTELLLRREIPGRRDDSEIIAGIRELFELVDAAGLAMVGAPSATFREIPGSDRVAVDFAVPIMRAPAPTPDTEVRTVAPGLVARTWHRGGYGGIDTAYRALEQWVRASNMRTTGPLTEVFHIAPEDIDTVSELTIELMIPVAPEPTISARMSEPLAAAVPRIANALHEHGFDMITTLDLDPAGHGRDADEAVLVACGSRLVRRALGADARGAVPLLTNPVLVRTVAGQTTVDVVAPRLAESASAELHRIADETTYLLTAALECLL